MEVFVLPGPVPGAELGARLRPPPTRPVDLRHGPEAAAAAEPGSRGLQHGLALAGTVAAALRSRSRHRGHASKVYCMAASEEHQEVQVPPEEEAAEQLAALEAELEALEDELEDERVRQADSDQAAAMNKIDAKFDSISAPSKSVVAAGRGASSHGLGSVALCGAGEVAELLLERLKQEAPDGQQPVFLDLNEVSRLNFEEVDESLKNCAAAIICPDPKEATDEALERAKLGVRAVIGSAPEGLRKMVLLSHLGAQEGKGGFNLGAFFNQGSGSSWADIEDELTSTVRLRPSQRAIRHVIVRVGDPPEAGATAGEVRCLPAEEAGVEGYTSSQTAAEALLQVINLEVNSNFSLVQGPEGTSASWGELLLPFIGPEVWRTEISDVAKTVFFVQQWADEFFGPGKSAMRQGVKTPVELRTTSSGVVFKFRPLTAKEDPFDSLEEGGLEFIVEEPESGAPRLRICRCSYGWKVTPKENSERALVDKFQKDWAKVSEA